MKHDAANLYVDNLCVGYLKLCNPRPGVGITNVKSDNVKTRQLDHKTMIQSYN